jgi:hypothetical protein
VKTGYYYYSVLQFLNHMDSQYDTLGWGSARHNATTYTGQDKHRINARQTSMSLVGFQPTTPVFQWANTVHALDCVATVIGKDRAFLF